VNCTLDKLRHDHHNGRKQTPTYNDNTEITDENSGAQNTGKDWEMRDGERRNP